LTRAEKFVLIGDHIDPPQIADNLPQIQHFIKENCPKNYHIFVLPISFYRIMVSIYYLLHMAKKILIDTPLGHKSSNIQKELN
jgi:hypothetical protein